MPLNSISKSNPKTRAGRPGTLKFDFEIESTRNQLHQDLFCHLAVHVGEPERAAGMVEGQLLVIEA
jgi:hypothetical protein